MSQPSGQSVAAATSAFGLSPCVSSQRRYAWWITDSGAHPPRSTRRTYARIRPSAVNSVICVSSVIAPRRPYAST